MSVAPSPVDTEAPDHRSSVATLDKALDVLELFGPQVADLRLAEIAERCGMNRSSVQRLVHTLCVCGYLQRDASGAIALSHRGSALAYRYLTSNQLVDLALLQLTRLNTLSQMQCDLWVPDGSDVVNLAYVPATANATPMSPIGQRLAASSCVPGQALGLPSNTRDQTPVAMGRDAIAAPVTGADGQYIAAVAVTATARDIAQRPELPTLVAQAAQALSELHIQPWPRTLAAAPVTLPDMPMPADDPLFITSVARGLRCLETFCTHAPSMTLTDLHRATSLPIATLQRLLKTFAERGYIEKSPRYKTFRLAVRTVELLYKHQMGSHVLKSVWPRLVRLREATGLHCSFCVLEGTSIIHMLNVQSRMNSAFRGAYMGHRLPALSTSGGRAMLSRLPREHMEALLAQATIEPVTPYTVTDKDALRRLLDTARRLGYATTDEQSIMYEVNIAAPVVEPNGRVTGAIVVSAPKTDWTVERLEREVAPLLQTLTKPLLY